MMIPHVKAFFDNATNTISYVVSDPKTNNCAVIDTVLDYDMSAGRACCHCHIDRNGALSTSVIRSPPRSPAAAAGVPCITARTRPGSRSSSCTPMNQACGRSISRSENIDRSM